MRVPADAGKGKAKVTVSFPAWKEGNVTPATFEVRIQEAPADETGKIDRSLAKEPAYQSKSPKYCLLVFGQEGKTRVWLVFDSVPDPLKPGEAKDYLYVDRNGNGNLTEDGERVPATVHKRAIYLSFGRGRAPYEPLLEFDVGEIGGADGKAKHKGLKVQVHWYRGKERPCNISLKMNGQWDQYVSGVIFSNKPQDAPVLHFAGGLTMRLANDEAPRLSLTEAVELYAEIGTPGVGKNSFVALGAHCVPKDVHPMVEIEFPAKSPDKPLIKTTVVLKSRC